MNTDDNPSAFPNPEDAWNSREWGLTMRDWFAGQAINGVVAHLGPGQGDSSSGVPATIAEAAYEIADAMMEARKRKEK